MTDREPRTVRVDPDVWDEFVAWIIEQEGSKRGNVGQHVENALEEYVDHDRYARVEERQRDMDDKLDAILATLSEADDSHTHKGHASPTTVTEKAETISAKLRQTGDVVFGVEVVEGVIADVAGADKRTHDKYKKELKRTGEAYEHPNAESDVWTVEKTVWADWVESYVNNVPDAHIIDVLSDYPVDMEDYERTVDEWASA